jgi:hypothetical protein
MSDDRVALLEEYRGGTAAVEDALAELDDSELDHRPEPGEWTIREVIHHLGDAEMRSCVRLRQLLADDNPVIQGYNEAAYAARLHYQRPLGAALDAMRIARRLNLELLESLGEQEWQRNGTHSENGPYTVLDWLRIYTAHPQEHADQIRALRASRVG